MALKRLSIEQLLGLNKFEVDAGEAHIFLDKESCRLCTARYCTVACPAGCYRVKNGTISFDYAGCLECGTCRVICPLSTKALVWRYPRGGFGIHFRFG